MCILHSLFLRGRELYEKAWCRWLSSTAHFSGFSWVFHYYPICKRWHRERHLVSTIKCRCCLEEHALKRQKRHALSVMTHKKYQDMYMTPNTISMPYFAELPIGIQYHITMILLENSQNCSLWPNLFHPLFQGPHYEKIYSVWHIYSPFLS